MARIRSIKPDFWKSEAIAALTLPTRLTFIGLWTYVDDNGVGLDNAKLITAELYALEDDPRDTLASVQRSLDELHNAGRIVRYSLDSKKYLSIVNWSEHQKIDRPGKPRYPQPTAEGALILTRGNTPNGQDLYPPFATPSRESREPSAESHLSEQGAGSREQGAGIRGAGDSAYARAQAPRPAIVVSADLDRPQTPATVGALALATEPQTEPGNDDTTRELLAGWLRLCPSRPHSSVVGAIHNEITSMLTEGIAPDAIAKGLPVWQRKAIRPGLLPQIVHETAQVGAVADTGPTAATTKATGWLSLAPSAAAPGNGHPYGPRAIGGSPA